MSELWRGDEVNRVMLIKTTHDSIGNQFFMAYSGENDTEQDYNLSKIFYKIWVMNTSNKLLQPTNKNEIKAQMKRKL